MKKKPAKNGDFKKIKNKKIFLQNILTKLSIKNNFTFSLSECAMLMHHLINQRVTKTVT